MNIGNLAVGAFVRWVADRPFKSWDTYGIIAGFTEGGVKIMTYDDFKESEIAIKGEALRNEISPAAKEEVALYLKRKRVSLIAKIQEIQITADEAERIEAVKLERVNTCIKQLTE